MTDQPIPPANELSIRRTSAVVDGLAAIRDQVVQMLVEEGRSKRRSLKSEQREALYRNVIDRYEEALAMRPAPDAVLREALEPFDDALGEDDEFPDDTPITVKWGRTTYYALTLGDLRRARNARNALGRKG